MPRRRTTQSFRDAETTTLDSGGAAVAEGGVRVLLVEDDPSFLGQLSDYVDYRGWTPVPATRGAEALEAFEREPCDLVLCDVMLPGIDGFETIARLRRLPDGVDVPVVMISAVWHDPLHFQSRLLSVGALEFHRKPLSILELGRRMAAILDEGDAEPAAGAATRSGRWRHPAIDAAVRVELPPPPSLGAWRLADLIRLMIRLFQEARSGVLTLSCEGVRREVLLLDGFPIHARSDSPAEGLASALVSDRLIEPGKVPGLLLAARQTNKPARQVVLDSGLVIAEQLLRAEERRIRALLDACFDVRGGDFELHEGEQLVAGVAATEIHPVPMLYRQLERVPVRDLAADLAPRSALRVVRGPEFDRLHTELSLPRNLDWLEGALDEGVTLQQLLARPRADREQLLRSLWFMLQLGIADAVPAEQAPGQTQRLRPSDRRPPVLVVPVADGPPPPLRDEWRRVLSDHVALYEADYYQLLGVSGRADGDGIDAAWKRRTARWRDAGLDPEAPPEVRSRARALLARVVEGRDVLMDRRRRLAYDRQLRRQERQRARLEGTATQRLRQARVAMDNERWGAAARLWRSLLLEHPSSVEVFQNLAWSQVQERPADRQVLDEAVELLRYARQLDPSHGRVLEHLATLYDRRDEPDAAAECRRALVEMRTSGKWPVLLG